MEKKIFIDFDDTLVDSTKVVVDIYNRRYSANADIRNMKRHDLLDECPRIGDSCGGDYEKEVMGYYSSCEF